MWKRTLCREVQLTQKKCTFPDMPYLHVLSLLRQNRFEGEEVNLLFRSLRPCPLLRLPKRMLAANGKTSIISWTEVSALAMRLIVLYCVVLFQTQYVHSGRRRRFLIQKKKMKSKSLAAWASQLFFNITFSISVLLCTLLRAGRISLWFKHCAEAREVFFVSDSAIGLCLLGRN